MWHWVKRDLPAHAHEENVLTARGPAANCRNALEMFQAFVDEDLLDLMHLETNRQRIALNRHHVSPVSKSDLRIFLGIGFYMRIVDLPFRRMYWSAVTRQNIVSENMSCNRFEQILAIIHLNDNELMRDRGDAGYDRLHKIRPLLEKLNVQFEACAEKEMKVSVDEQIVPFKGRHSLKVYMMKKPNKWGYKVWAMAGSSGYVHKFMFAGDNLGPPQEAVAEGLNVGKSGQVVLQLCNDQPQGSYVYFDNYFASPDLLLELKRRGIHATCTVQAKRTKKCPLMCLKDLKRRGRGSYDYRSDTNLELIICEWFDNKIVTVGSNVHGVEPPVQVRRYDRANKRHINIPCPALIREYNANMGGVDKCDMLLALYRNTMKGTKWYKRIFFHLMDLCVVNAWLLYKASRPECKLQLIHFKLDVAKGLILTQRPAELTNEPVPQVPQRHQSQSARNVCVNSRADRVDHFPKKMDVKHGQRCKMVGCTRKSMFMCRKCHVYLCITGKHGDEDCFYLFHYAQ